MQDFLIGNKERYVVFHGTYGEDYIEELQKRICISFFVEDNPSDSSLHDIPVISSDTYWKSVYVPEDAIIMAETWDTRAAMIALEERGLVYNRDFCFYRNFIYQYDFWKENICQVFYTEMIITTFCDLRCKDCTYHIPYLPTHRHRPIEELIRDIDLYFAAVDKVSIFRVLGGETLLHPELTEFLTYIGANYRDKINELVLVTNGTVKPKEELIGCLLRHKIKMVISDYSKNVEKVRKLIPALREQMKKVGVQYKCIAGDWWEEVGDTHFDNNLSEAKLSLFFHRCEAFCRVLHQGKLFYCGRSIIAAEEGRMKETDMTLAEYVSLHGEASAVKEKVIELCAGWGAGKYLKACRFCKGTLGPIYGKKIPCGIQLEE